MKAMIFAAGLGTRLRPLTNDRPKALVEVGGKTLLQRSIEHLVQHGVDEITINIHHFGEKIIEYLAEHNNFGLNIHISDERDLLLDTGGGLLKARPFLDGNEPFIIQNADILTDLNLHEMYRYHMEHQALATLLVKERVTQRYLLFNDQNSLNGWINKSTGETKPAGVDYKQGVYQELAFGGVHVISPLIFDLLEKFAHGQSKFSIIPFYIDQCTRHNIQGFQPQESYKWLDVGKPETLEQAKREFC